LRLCRPHQSTPPTRKYRRPPRRRRSAPEAWADAEVSPPRKTRGGAQRTIGAAAPSEKPTGGMTSVSSDFCGFAAPINQHLPLENIVVRPADGAPHLRLGPTRRSALQGKRGARPTHNRRGRAQRKTNWRDDLRVVRFLRLCLLQRISASRLRRACRRVGRRNPPIRV
jgi:hypothetical protein